MLTKNDLKKIKKVVDTNNKFIDTKFNDIESFARKRFNRVGIKINKIYQKLNKLLKKRIKKLETKVYSS